MSNPSCSLRNRYPKDIPTKLPTRFPIRSSMRSQQDKSARVAAETLVNTGLVVLAGEITTHANVDYIQIARDTVKRIGWPTVRHRFRLLRDLARWVAYDKQSPDIAQGVIERQGTGSWTWAPAIRA